MPIAHTHTYSANERKTFIPYVHILHATRLNCYWLVSIRQKRMSSRAFFTANFNILAFRPTLLCTQIIGLAQRHTPSGTK
jgi:hypothetical protein